MIKTNLDGCPDVHTLNCHFVDGVPLTTSRLDKNYIVSVISDKTNKRSINILPDIPHTLQL